MSWPLQKSDLNLDLVLLVPIVQISNLATHIGWILLRVTRLVNSQGSENHISQNLLELTHLPLPSLQQLCQDLAASRVQVLLYVNTPRETKISVCYFFLVFISCSLLSLSFCYAHQSFVSQFPSEVLL